MTWRDAIERHYERVWVAKAVPCLFSSGPVHQLPRGFNIVKFPPNCTRDMWTFATCGMSQPEDAKAVELHMFSPHDAYDVVELLVITAHFHRTHSRLDLGHSVNFGRPWLPRSACNFGLVSLPYLDGPALENFDHGGVEASCYWLLPVTGSEIAFKKEVGLDALEERFEAAGLNYLDPHRDSVV